MVVPVNPMNLTDELRHYVSDSGAQGRVRRAGPVSAHAAAAGRRAGHVVVATYSDYLERPTDLHVPDFVSAPRAAVTDPGVVAWADALAPAPTPAAACTAGPDDLSVMPYTSGTTGHPKGCMHTHRTVMYNTVAGGSGWTRRPGRASALAVLPLFHVTGMQNSMNGPIYGGATIVLLPRWDRDAAASCVQRYRVTGMALITTMVVDFLSNPRLGEYDLSSLRSIGGGGAAMPEAVAPALEQKLRPELPRGLRHVRDHGRHAHQPARAPEEAVPGHPDLRRRRARGRPGGTERAAAGRDRRDHRARPAGHAGLLEPARGHAEALSSSSTASASCAPATSAYVDEDGYFFIVDRLKRMINASGFKVWPAEVEALLYHHPAIQEACVIAAEDARRGETVKAVVVLKPGFEGQVTEQEIIDWSHEHMAAYKVPRIVQFVPTPAQVGHRQGAVARAAGGREGTPRREGLA